MNERTGPTPDDDEDERRARRSALLHDGGPMNDAPPWTLTYADLISQLNGLFILMLTFAHFVPANFQRLAGSVQATFGAAVENSGTVDADPPPPDAPPSEAAASREAGVLSGLRGLVARHGGRLRGGVVDIEVFEDYRGVVLRLGQPAFFEPGEAIVRPGAWVFLDALGELMSSEAARVEIEVRVGDAGAMDPALLAGLRGTHLVHYLAGRDAGLDTSRLSVLAVGLESGLPPVASNVRRAAADRVDIVFTRSAAQPESPP
jgi:hypothetical protein